MGGPRDRRVALTENMAKILFQTIYLMETHGVMPKYTSDWICSTTPSTDEYPKTNTHAEKNSKKSLKMLRMVFPGFSMYKLCLAVDVLENLLCSTLPSPSKPKRPTPALLSRAHVLPDNEQQMSVHVDVV